MTEKPFPNLFVFALFAVSLTSANMQLPNLNPNSVASSKTLGDCQACKVFVESFQNALDRTARGKFEGGDAAWEEEKLKNYKRSEIRLVEIQESVCKELQDYSVSCHNIGEKAEEFIEDWWSTTQDDTGDIFTYLCIEKLQYCCPKHHFGKDCQPCPTTENTICSGNGKCKGDGTRKGNGQCQCDLGYVGDTCNECAFGYFKTLLDDKMVKCLACHPSCEGCTQIGPKSCIVCKKGYHMDTEEGCIDINECDRFDTCEKNQFCVNTEGSYSCLYCDKACETCYGDGPDLCRRCANGYSKKGEFCIKDREDEHNHDHLTTSRYITYFGLLVATGILLPRSTVIGSFVGTLVLSYIIGAEYYCMINGHSHALINIRDFQLFDFFKV